MNHTWLEIAYRNTSYNEGRKKLKGELQSRLRSDGFNEWQYNEKKMSEGKRDLEVT